MAVLHNCHDLIGATHIPVAPHLIYKDSPDPMFLGSGTMRLAIAIKNDSSDDGPSRFENSFRRNPACYVVKYSEYKHCMKILARKAKSHEMN